MGATGATGAGVGGTGAGAGNVDRPPSFTMVTPPDVLFTSLATVDFGRLKKKIFLHNPV